jgi:hypothetical protein
MGDNMPLSERTRRECAHSPPPLVSEEARKSGRVRKEGMGRRVGGDRAGALLRCTAPCTSIRSLSLGGTEKQGGSGVAAAAAKTSQANNLIDQDLRLSPDYEKALALLKKALGIYEAELSKEVRGAGLGKN